MLYDNESCNTFVADMESAGLKVEHYRGYFWEGPAVRVADIADVMAVTHVRCQADNMGLGYVVYPLQPGRLV